MAFPVLPTQTCEFMRTDLLQKFFLSTLPTYVKLKISFKAKEKARDHFLCILYPQVFHIGLCNSEIVLEIHCSQPRNGKSH